MVTSTDVAASPKDNSTPYHSTQDVRVEIEPSQNVKLEVTNAEVENDLKTENSAKAENDVKVENSVKAENDIEIDNDAKEENDVKAENDAKAENDIQPENEEQVENGEKPAANEAEPGSLLIFESMDTRIAFIQKVLAIKFLQLTTCVLCLIPVAYDKYWFYRYTLRPWSTFIVMGAIAYIGCYGSLLCSRKIQQKRLYRNIMLLACPLSFVFLVSVLLGSEDFFDWFFMSIVYLWSVLLTLVLYCVFTLRTKRGFRVLDGFGIAAVVLVVVFLIFKFLTFFDAEISSLAPMIVAYVYVTYALTDIHAMVTNKHHSTITPADYEKAALYLHVDHILWLKYFVKRRCFAN